MGVPELVDESFEAFAAALGQPLGEAARDLPRSLRLAPRRIPWSRVFSHEVTLGAPALFAESMARVSRGKVRDAVLSHALGVIDAFGTDRIEDGQIDPDERVLAVLAEVRRERDRAIERVLGRAAAPGEGFAASDAATVSAIREERALLAAGRAVGLDEYERLSLAKQSAGLVATESLAVAAGWDAARRRAVRTTLEGIWLGLQMSDDVVDWEDDLRQGGAWAVCIARGLAGGSGEWPSAAAPAREHVLRAGALHKMMARAVGHVRTARRTASELGALGLAVWAGSLERKLDSLAEGEARSPGYTIRARALAAWAQEVLS
jgi:hypothetical protein